MAGELAELRRVGGAVCPAGARLALLIARADLEHLEQLGASRDFLGAKVSWLAFKVA